MACLGGHRLTKDTDTMLTQNERIVVEAIRKAPSVTIIIPGDGMSGDCRIKISSKSVSHDVAIAVQSYFNSCGISEDVHMPRPRRHYDRRYLR